MDANGDEGKDYEGIYGKHAARREEIHIYDAIQYSSMAWTSRRR